jgi:hypothetical protein
MSRVLYYYVHQGQQVGPVPFEQVKQLVEAGRLGPTALVWQVGTPAWVQAQQVPGLAVPPPLPPPAPLPPAAPYTPEPPPRRRPVPRRSRGPETVAGLYVIRGSARNVSKTSEVEADRYAAWTTQIVTFLIGSQAVEISLARVPHISPGDDIAVAGHLESGTLKARAFKNWSNGTHGSWRTMMNYGCSVGLFGTIFGVFMPPILPFALLLGLISLPFFFYSMWRTYRAISIVSDESLPSSD